jgi:uncharacterized protein YndB with AHSA1/START domain
MSDAATKSDAPVLTLEREFSHPPEAVFKAWTREEALRKWMGPGEVTAPESQMDARVGGKLIIPMITPDGKNPKARGEILELVPDRKLRFTWAWDQEDGSPGQLMEITLEFIPTDKGTKFTLHQTGFIDEETRDHHIHGWTGCCDKLEVYLAAL